MTTVLCGVATGVPQSPLFEDLARQEFASEEISERLRPMLRAAKRGRRLLSPRAPLQAPTLLCVYLLRFLSHEDFARRQTGSWTDTWWFVTYPTWFHGAFRWGRYCPRLTAHPWWTGAAETPTTSGEQVAARLERSWMRVLERAAGEIRKEFEGLASARASERTAQAVRSCHDLPRSIRGHRR
jgi:hypothetical protein